MKYRHWAIVSNELIFEKFSRNHLGVYVFSVLHTNDPVVALTFPVMLVSFTEINAWKNKQIRKAFKYLFIMTRNILKTRQNKPLQRSINYFLGQSGTYFCCILYSPVIALYEEFLFVFTSICLMAHSAQIVLFTRRKMPRMWVISDQPLFAPLLLKSK